MKLIIMRHCKSAWDTPGDDHDRVLNERGRQSAKVLGNWLKDNGHLPTQAIVSSAARTKDTFERLALDCPVSFHRDLYLAGPTAILSRLIATAQSDTVLVIGHNPGIAEFAEMLVATPPAHPSFLSYPTGFSLIVETDLTCHQAEVVNAITPRDLLP